MKIIKSLIVMFLGSTCLLSAGTVTFTEFKSDEGNAQGWVDGIPVTSGSITQDGVTFTMTFSTVNPDAANVSLSSSGFSGVFGGVGDRLDSGMADDTSDDETFKIKLSVTGANLSSLSLSSITSQAIKSGENFDVTDGITVVNLMPPNRTLSYEDTLNGLIPLTVDNVGGQGDGTWMLEITARQKDSTTPSSISFDDFIFEYTVGPEPIGGTLIEMSSVGDTIWLAPALLLIGVIISGYRFGKNDSHIS